MADREHGLKIHPEATKAFNESAESHVHMIVQQAAPAQPQSSDFKPDTEPKFTIPESDISNISIVGTVDPLGRQTSKSFEWNGRQYEISGSSYIEMMKFVDQVTTAGTVRDTLSRSFIRDNLFDWLEMKFKGSAVKDWVSFLLDSATQAVQSREVWIPISTLHIQSDIQLGNITFSNLSKPVLEREVLSKFKVEDLPEQERQEIYQNVRQRYQGLAIARLKIWAEPTKAIEVARRETEVSLKLLTCYHLASVKGELVSSSSPKGQEYVPEYHAIIFDEKRGFKIESHLDFVPFRWKIDNQYLAHMRALGLEQIHKLHLEQKNEFQRKALEFFVDYGGSFLSRSVPEKILRLVVALEKFLAPSSAEPTQATIADRLAFCVGSDQNDRRRIVRITKIIYGWRSRLVHSALEISEEETLKEFLLAVWRFFELLTRSLDSFSTMEEFYEHLDQRKYA